MKKYNLKKDLKQISHFTVSAFIILVIFLFFAVIILFPIYLFSKFYPGYYSISASIILLTGLIILLIKKFLHIWNLYKKTQLFLLHITVTFILPILLIFILIFLETLLFRISFEILTSYLAYTALIGGNLLFAGIFIFIIRRMIYNLKSYLKQNQIKGLVQNA